MLSHDHIWSAIDRLAARQGLTASGLARRAGLDPTTFNKSKRRLGDGRLRWPNCESIAKVLDATGTSLADFLDVVEGARSAAHGRIPGLPAASAARLELFDDRGRPQGEAWGTVDFPRLAPEIDPGALFGLEVTLRDFEPLYRPGDLLILAPDAPLRPGNRVVAQYRDGRLEPHRLLVTEGGLRRLGPLLPDRTASDVEAAAVRWIARIVWISQ